MVHDAGTSLGEGRRSPGRCRRDCGVSGDEFAPARPRARTFRNNRSQRDGRRSTSSQDGQLRGPPSPPVEASRLLGILRRQQGCEDSRGDIRGRSGRNLRRTQANRRRRSAGNALSCLDASSDRSAKRARPPPSELLGDGLPWSGGRAQRSGMTLSELNDLPSSDSRKAPPPVETWLTLSARPNFSTASADSPPPTAVTP